MSAALGWIGDLVKFIADWFPRPVLCTIRHRLIRHSVTFWGLWSPYTVLSQGLHWWWPALQELETYPIKRQVLRVPLAALMTEDLEPVSGVVILTYDVVDTVKYGIDHQDADDDLSEACFRAGRDRIRSCTLEELAEADAGQQDEELKDELSSDLAPMGVRVLEACMGVAPCSVHHLAGMELPAIQADPEE